LVSERSVGIISLPLKAFTGSQRTRWNWLTNCMKTLLTIPSAPLKNWQSKKAPIGSFKDLSGKQGPILSEKNYRSERWLELLEEINEHGVRNGWLMAVAPNSSTAKIGGSTDGIDPIYSVEYAEEKKNFKFKVTAPDLNHKTYLYYRRARHELDQVWSIKQNAARQRHIDQGISFNLYVRHDIKAKELLNLHLEAWKHGLKTTYYVRSTSQAEIAECEACQS